MVVPTIAPVVKSDVATEVFKQYRLELKGDEIKYNEDLMLRQKYGIISPQFTLSENHLIRKEERNASRR